MITIKNKILKYSLLAFVSIDMKAQDAPTAAGGDATGTGGSIAYSVGQIVYTSISSSSGSLSQGVQQPYEITTTTGIEEVQDIQLQCSVYPNPTTDYIILKVENENYKNLSFQLIDISGQLLENKKITDVVTSITMSEYSSSTYFLKVTENNKEVKTFKIIKN